MSPRSRTKPWRDGRRVPLAVRRSYLDVQIRRPFGEGTHHVRRPGVRRVCLLLVATAAASGGQTRRPAPDFGALDRYVADAVRDWHVPGLAIAIVKDDSL